MDKLVDVVVDRKNLSPQMFAVDAKTPNLLAARVVQLYIVYYNDKRFSDTVLTALAKFLEKNREFVRWTPVNNCWRHALMKLGDFHQVVGGKLKWFLRVGILF